MAEPTREQVPPPTTALVREAETPSESREGTETQTAAEHPILRFQRQAGNQAVARMLEGRGDGAAVPVPPAPSLPPGAAPIPATTPTPEEAAGPETATEEGVVEKAATGEPGPEAPAPEEGEAAEPVETAPPAEVTPAEELAGPSVLAAPELPAPPPFEPIPFEEPPGIREIVASAVPAAGPVAKTTDPAKARAEAAALVAQLQASTVQRKADVFVRCEQLKSDVIANGQSAIEAVRDSVSANVELVRAQYAEARESVRARAEQTKTIVTAKFLLGYGQALLQSTLQAALILLLASTYKGKASKAVATRQEDIRSFGEKEGKRGREAVEGQAAEATERGQEKAAGYPNDDRGRVQAEAVLKVASETAGKLREPAADVEAGAVDGAEELADGLNGADREIAAGIDSNALQVGLQIGLMSIDLKTQFDAFEKTVHAGIDTSLSLSLGFLDEAEAAAVNELFALEAELTAQIDDTVAVYIATIDQERDVVMAFVDQTVAVTSDAVLQEDQPDVDGVREVVGAAQASVEEALGKFIDAVTRGTLHVVDSIRSVVEGAIAGLISGTMTVVNGLVSILTAIFDSFTQILDAADQGIKQMNEAWSNALGDIHGELEKSFQDALTQFETGLDQSIVEAKTAVTAKIDEAVEKNREPLDSLDAEMEKAAEEAREEYDAAWYEKFLTWDFWKNFLLSILKGVLILLAIVVAAVVGVILIIVGILSGSILAIIAGVVLLLAVVGFILYGIIDGIYQRWKTASGFWQSTWAVVVGVLDLVGIPNIIEGVIGRDLVTWRKLTNEEAGARLGSGIIGLITLIIPIKGLKGKAPKPKAPGPRVPVPPPKRVPIPEKPKIPVPEKPPIPEKPPTPVPEKPPAPVPEKPPKMPEGPPEKPKIPEEPPKRPREPEEPPPKPKEPEEPTKPKPEEPPPKPKEPEEPKTPEEIEEAKRREAEQEVSDGREVVKNKADLEALKKKEPHKDKPPEDLDPADKQLWDDYVDYWHERVEALEKELNANPDKPPKTKPPLTWKAYSEFLAKFRRGRRFQDKTTAALTKERADLDIQSDVGVKKPGETTKFVDQLGYDKAAVKQWENAGKPKDQVPPVECFSNKSRKFVEISDIDAQVKADVAEAITKYGGAVEVRRPGHPMFGFTVLVKQLTLIYDGALAPVELRPQIIKAAEGSGVIVEFR